MVNPVNLQLAHWNLEHTAQQNRDPAAAAAQAGRQGEGVTAALHRDASVQAAEESAEEERLTRKKERERREERKKKAAPSEEKQEEQEGSGEKIQGRVDFYA